MKLFEMFGDILLNDKASSELKKVGEVADKVGEGLVKGVATVAKWGAAIVAAGATAAAAFGTTAVKAAGDFEQQLANVATLLDGDVKSKISAFSDGIKKLSVESNVNTALLTDGLYQVISAVGETADSMIILETAAKGAKAGNATVTDSVNLLAVVMKGYGEVSAEAATKASDLAFQTVKLGQYGSVVKKLAA